MSRTAEAKTVGPAVAGLVLASFGPGWAFLLNALSFLAVIAALLLMRPAERRTARAQGSILAQFGEAVAYSRRHTGILTAFGLTAAVCGLGYPAFQLAPVFAQRVYHIGPGQYGALTGAYGFGAIVGAVVLGVLGAHRLRSDLVRVASAAYGLTLVGFGLTRSFPQGVVLLGLVGMASLPVIAALNTAIQTQVPQHLRGRVLALWVLSYTSSYPVGAVLQGWLADRIGPGPTVVAAGLVMCLVAGSLFARPAVARSLDAYLEPAPEIVVTAEPVTSPQ